MTETMHAAIQIYVPGHSWRVHHGPSRIPQSDTVQLSSYLCSNPVLQVDTGVSVGATIGEYGVAKRQGRDLT